MSGAPEPGDEATPPGAEWVVTSPLSLARVLWWYGEDDLWAPALELAPAAVADLAPRFAVLRAEPEVMELVWPGAPLRDAHLVVGTLEHLEGAPDPRCAGTAAALPCPTCSTSARTSAGTTPPWRKCSGSSGSGRGRSRTAGSPGSCSGCTVGTPRGDPRRPRLTG